ncbi:MAG: T9SS type A sorting domain-containing protein [bacterium]
MVNLKKKYQRMIRQLYKISFFILAFCFLTSSPSKAGDFELAVESSGIQEVKLEENSDGEPKLYPNPATKKFTIEAPANSYINCMTITGKKLWTRKINGKETFDVPGVPGVYLVEIVTPNQQYVKQLVVLPG